MSEQDEQEQVEPETQEQPDEGAGPDVEPIVGDQGEQVSEQVAETAAASGFNPDAPVRTSAPPPEAQSGLPPLQENADLEPQPQYAGPVEPGTEGTAPEDREPDEQTTTPASPSE